MKIALGRHFFRQDTVVKGDLQIFHIVSLLQITTLSLDHAKNEYAVMCSESKVGKFEPPKTGSGFVHLDQGC